MSTDHHDQVAQIDHIALAAGDLQSVCDFYRLLGGVAAPLGEGIDGCAIDFCGVRLEVYERARGRPALADMGFQRLLHLAFALGSADAVDNLSRLLAERGHRVLEPPHRAGPADRYESVVLDTDGNRLRLTV
jgi:lactoylglutathione lyase